MKQSRAFKIIGLSIITIGSLVGCGGGGSSDSSTTSTSNVGTGVYIDSAVRESVDTSTLGTYTITYVATNDAENSSTIPPT